MILQTLNQYYERLKDDPQLNPSLYNSKTVGQYLDGITKGLTVAEFKRVTIA